MNHKEVEREEKERMQSFEKQNRILKKAIKNENTLMHVSKNQQLIVLFSIEFEYLYIQQC